ncbi:MAG: asparagine synthase-related protein [Candidatus Moranbacteria bacterium]|nr:asparagine synthase-related protein [Candidatus Moranbacteria bacterium]
MCGIAGIINADKYAGEANIIKMLAQIEHRGNNNYEYQVFDGAVLGTNRLAIVDREHAKQPIVSEDGRYAIAYNGEIYNYKTIKNKLIKEGYKFFTDSDTETLLAGYIKWGAKVLDEVVGMYGFVIYDTKNKSFFAARDIIGVKPLYYAENKKGEIYFASEMKELAILPDVKEIKELAPGHYFENSLQPKKYFELKRKRIYSDEDFVVKKLRELFDNAVKIRVDTDLPVGVQVSGGVDSTAVLATAIKYHKNVTAIIVGAEGAEDPIYAERYCKENNIKYIKQIEPIEKWQEHWNELIEQAIYTGESIEPNPIRNMPMNMIASRLAKKAGINIVLLGEGADELCAGYPEFREELDMDVVEKKILKFVGDLHRTQIQRVDRASMFYTVENRTPFFDRDFVEFALQIDPQLFLKKMEDGQVQEKYVLRQAVKDRLPEYVYNRPKLAFNAGTGMGSNGPDHNSQTFIEEKYSEEEYAKDQIALAKKIKFFNINTKIETYLLKRCVENGYDKAKFMKNRVAANAKNIPNQKKF